MRTQALAVTSAGTPDTATFAELTRPVTAGAETMALEFATETEIPEPIRADFEEREGKWVPKGFVPLGVHKSVLDEKFKLIPELDTLKAQAAKWGKDDPETLRQARKELDELKRQAEASKVGKTDEELETIVNERFKLKLGDKDASIEALSAQIKALNGTVQQKDELLSERVIDVEVRSAGSRAAAKGYRYEVPNVVRDTLREARTIFKVEEGTPIARDKDGRAMLGADGKSNLTIDEWLMTEQTRSPHWFKTTASGGGAETSGGVINGSYLLSREQARNPIAYKQAKERAEKAGVPLQIEA